MEFEPPQSGVLINTPCLLASKSPSAMSFKAGVSFPPGPRSFLPFVFILRVELGEYLHVCM